MKRVICQFAVAAVASVVAGSVLAETVSSTSGGPVTTANIVTTVTVPKLMLLRVGPAATPGTLTFAPTLSFNTAPNWDGTDPTSSGTPPTLSAYAYTNNANGAKLTCATAGYGQPNGPFAGDVAVGFVVLTAGRTVLAHPGGVGATLASCSTSSSNITRNEVFDATWTYTLNNVVTGIAAGTYTMGLTYTLTNL